MDDYNDSFEQTSSSSSDSGNAEAENLETIPSAATEALDSSVSQTPAVPVPQFVNSTNDARIEAPTPDMVQEVTQHSFLTQGSTMSSTDSLPSYGALAERRRAAINAVDEPKFQFLSNFKAFDSISHSPMDTPLIEGGLAFTPVHSGKEVSLSGANHLSVTKTNVTQSFSKNDMKRKFTKKDSTLREDSSSVFSTLSQHLKTAKQTQVVLEADPRAASVPHEASLIQDVDREIQYDPPNPDSAVHPVVIKPSVKDIKSAPPICASLPNLPPSSLLMKNIEEADHKPSNPPMTTPTSNMLITTAHEAVPPLPPPRMVQLSPEAQTFTIDPKLLELRETSEAVERLVKAFALLRGQFTEQASPDNASFPPSFQTSAKETLTSTAYHKVRGDTTVRAISTRAPMQPPYVIASHLNSPPSVQHPPPLTPSLSEDEITALKANEAKVEETLMVCVLEMLKRELANPQRVQRLVDSLKARPPHEIITADEFKANSVSFGSRTGATTACGESVLHHKNIYSVFDSDMCVFDGSDEDAASALFNSIQEAIHKYVFHHVVNGIATRPLTTKQRTVSPITPHFSWILLLDLLAVCEEITELGFARGDTAPMGPLLVRYNGDDGCEFIARNAIQCLPFEVLETVGGTERRKPVFRLDFWVTKDKMRVITAAITDCIRQNIVHEARVRPYMGLLENDLEIDPTVLVPSKGRLFSFIKPNTLGNTVCTTAWDDDTSYRHGGWSSKVYMQKQGSIKHGKDLEDSESTFGVDQKALQQMAYAVSVISTDVLASFASSEGIKTPSVYPSFRNTSNYEDLSKAVAETVCELLNDTAVKASIERRARDKFVQMLKEKKEYPGKNHLEKERLVIERAEKEAEDMIKRIVQQMSLKTCDK
ncbi:unnamed protein product [Phytomonas sp. EM1]|nr:unnamed protein product [Phytomonas sp. EM1]|eukprot:CCW59543.1 unnamed protein product [Phytomonas sp. isolate EM1]